MHQFIAAVLLATLAGCASIEIKLPVTGRLGGQTAFGYALLKGDGNSMVTVDTTSGLRCEAPLNTKEDASSYRSDLACNDGRKGELVTNRSSVGKGTATATLSDGTKGQFVYGRDVRYEDEFPGPDATAPVKPQTPPRRR